ncbi:serine/threonine kinase-like protein 3 [Sarcoptes scabiei]|uniref:Serine/threonine kinase-like protein 3 n=1 Tax=Sarcoptes scabiei TaxID=52283 RepID=A0A132A4R0_SARSC|nr:serine/threonine kinase-like protein 3 [Sarcoptes scabiei]
MPYLDHQMATSISDYMSKSKNVSSSSSSSSSSSLNQQETMRSAKLIRTMASCTKASSKNLSTSRKEQLDEQLSTSKYKIEIDLRKLLYLRNLLKAEIEILLRPKRIPRSQNCPNYKDYLVDYDKQLFDDGRSKYYHSINQKYPTKQLCCRIIEPSASSPELSKLLESNNLYWRILKHLGKKHQYIVQTWDLFLNDKNSLEIHQEYCPLGDLDRFVRSNSLSEQQIALYAWQLLKGLDFLGDIGISHRNIQPKNLFLVPGEPENCLKITNLENAIIYWNIENNDIVFQSCLPISQQLVDGENFQAPEIYGDPNEEEFDPIKADTWSYGAVLYFMSNKTYPFKISSESIDLEQEIQSNIDKLSLSELGKELLRALLKTDSNERMPIGFIEKSDWFDQAKKCRIRMKEPQTLAKENRPNRAEKANKFFQSKVFGRPTDDADESEGGGVKMEKIEKQSLPMTVSKAKPKSKSKKKKSVSKSSSSISASKSKLRKKSRSRSTKKSTSISKESLSTATAASATSIADGDGSTDAVSSKKDLTVSKLKGETRRGALNSFSDSLSSSKSTSIQTSDVLKRDLAEDEQKTIALNQSITKDLVGLNEDEKKKNEISSKSINRDEIEID